jgi:hypothetical protein
MKAAGPGPTVGIALEGFSGERGTVLMLVQRGPGAASDVVGTTTAAVERVVDAPALEPDGNLQPVRERSSNDRRAERTIDLEAFRVDEYGNVWTRGSLRSSATELAESYPVTHAVEPGDVLVIDRDVPGALRHAAAAADPAVVGIVSAEPGVLLGSGDPPDEDRLGERRAAIAVAGSVLCKVDAGYGSIRPGDLLTTSPTPGHAMRADDPQPGTIVGKALDALETGAGAIRVLVILR